MNPTGEPVKQRILVVDDNPSIHEDFRKILCPQTSESSANVANLIEEVFGVPQRTEREGFEMDSAFQGQEALAKVETADQQKRPYALAFIDVRMPPGWDGIETVKRIWKEHPQVQVVICTAYSDYSWDEILQTLGKTDSLVILKKPFDNVEVLQLAHTLTEKWMLSQRVNARMADLDELVQQRTRELLEANHQLQAEIQTRTAVENALRESEERFHQAFEAVAVPVAITRMQTGTFLDVNQSFQELCGRSKSDVLDRTAQDLNLIVDTAAFGEMLQDLLNGKRLRNAPLDIRRKDGEIRQTLASIELLKLGQHDCLLSAFQDVTEQKSLEQQLHHSQKLEAVGQLAAGVAHDFNNLLTVIHGYASLQLAKTNLESDVAKAFGQVKSASERAAALTRQLLAFSRRQIVQRHPLDLGAALLKMKGILSRALGEMIQLECHLAPGLPCVNGDESNLDQVFMNLAVNARDAMPDGGKLTFTTSLVSVTEEQAQDNPDRRVGDFLQVMVTDTGCGIEPQVLNRIFEPFFTTKPIGRGTGLGLSTVYGILKQHDGWIEVESQLGVGTTFRIFLPASTLAANPVSEATPSFSAHSKPISSKDDLIFVVEDEPAVREFITNTLTREGFKIVQAASGAEALHKWHTIVPRVRLLLTDMVMPGGISGRTLATHQRRHYPELRVVYTSGYNPEVVDNGHSLKEGLNFLPKPFTCDQLVAVVRQALTVPHPVSD